MVDEGEAPPLHPPEGAALLLQLLLLGGADRPHHRHDEGTCRCQWSSPETDGALLLEPQSQCSPGHKKAAYFDTNESMREKLKTYKSIEMERRLVA